jgi:hypothetical protein
MRTFQHSFSTILGLALFAIHLSGCGILNAELHKFANQLSNSPTPTPSSFEAVSLSDGSLLGKNKFVGFQPKNPGGTTTDTSGNLAAIEADGIHIYASDGSATGFIALDRTLYPNQLNSNAIIAAASDGSYFIGGIPNGNAQALLKISPSGVITPITMTIPCYGFRDIEIMTLNGEEVVHVSIPQYQGGASSGPLDPSLISIYKLDGTHISDYGSEASRPEYMAQAPNGEIYALVEGGTEIFHFQEDGDYIDSYDFGGANTFNQIAFASNGDLMLLRIAMTSDAGVYRYTLPTMTLVTSVTTATNPELDYPVDMLLTSAGFDVNVGTTNDTRKRLRYQYSAGAYTLQTDLSSAGTGLSEFSFGSSFNAQNLSASDSSENIYILDEGNRRILSFTKSGSSRFSANISHADISSFATSAITVTSANQVITMSVKDLTTGNMYLQKFSGTNGASQGTVDIAWPYPLSEFVGIDSQNRLWFYVSNNPGLGLVAINLAGTVVQTIDTTDTTTYFGTPNLMLFRIIGDHIFAIDSTTFKSWVSDFAGNAELLFADDQYTTANILAGITSTLKTLPDGSYYMLSIDPDYTTTATILFDFDQRKITKKLTSLRISQSYMNILTSLGLWQGLPDNLMMLLEY